MKMKIYDFLSKIATALRYKNLISKISIPSDRKNLIFFAFKKKLNIKALFSHVIKVFIFESCTFIGICHRMKNLLNWIALSMKYSSGKYFFDFFTILQMEPINFKLSLIVISNLFEAADKREKLQILFKMQDMKTNFLM